MSLSDLLKTTKKPSVVLGELQTYLMYKPDVHELEEPRADAWHPSGLTGCPRQLLLSRYGVAPDKVEKPAANKVMVFDVGHHFGYMMQEYFYGMGILFGAWKCLKCDHEWVDLDQNPSPRICPKCGEKLWIWYNLRYKEVPLTIPELGIVGKADAKIFIRNTMHLVELKTIRSNSREGAYGYEGLSSPIPAHLYQLNLYMYAAGVSKGVFMYGNKNDQNIKEFPVSLMQDIYVQPVLDKVSYMNRYYIGRKVCPRPSEALEDKMGFCKGCEYLKICWGVNSENPRDYIRKGEM